MTIEAGEYESLMLTRVIKLNCSNNALCRFKCAFLYIISGESNFLLYLPYSCKILCTVLFNNSNNLQPVYRLNIAELYCVQQFEAIHSLQNIQT